MRRHITDQTTMSKLHKRSSICNSSGAQCPIHRPHRDTTGCHASHNLQEKRSSLQLCDHSIHPSQSVGWVSVLHLHVAVWRHRLSIYWITK